MSENVKIFTVPESAVGVRLDKFLADNLPGFSRSEVQKFTISPAVKLSQKIKVGEEYSVVVPDESPNHELRTPNHESSYKIANAILYEDNDIIVINKPRGITMYPGAGRETGTLVQMVLSHCELSRLGGELRPGVVHRLDRDTSGVVIMAKSDAAYRNLVKTFMAHDITRKYIAFVWGIPNWESADITGNIGRSARNRQKMTMVKIGGKNAETHVDVMNAWPRVGISEMRCTLLTGRTHQIRVHLSAHGFPVVCDPVYGRGTARYGSIKNPELLNFVRTHTGQMLHAELLELLHPITGEKLHFRARLPEDMTELKQLITEN